MCSSDLAKRRGSQKTVLERKAPPTFDVIIEILEVDKLAIHHDVAKVVDKMLRGQQPRPEIRVRNRGGEVEVVQKAEVPADRPGERTGGTYGVVYDTEPEGFGFAGNGRGDSRNGRDTGRGNIIGREDRKRGGDTRTPASTEPG